MGGVLKRRLSPLLRKIEAREERGVKASVVGGWRREEEETKLVISF